MPNKTNEHITGSTMIPEEMQTPHVNTRKVTTNAINMHGTEADGITTSPDSTDPKKLLTNFVMHQVRNDLNQSMKLMQSEIDDLSLSPVLTPPIAAPNFTDLSKWDMSDQWYIDNGRAYFVNKLDKGIDQGILRLKTDAFMHPGTYFYNITIDEIMADGQLTLLNYKRKVILEMKEAGNYQGIFEVDNPTIFHLLFRADNFPKYSNMILGYAAIHFLKEEFKKYMNWVAINSVAGMTGFATSVEVNALLNTFKQQIQNYVNVATDTINERLNSLSERITKLEEK